MMDAWFLSVPLWSSRSHARLELKASAGFSSATAATSAPTCPGWTSKSSMGDGLICAWASFFAFLPATLTPLRAPSGCERSDVGLICLVWLATSPTISLGWLPRMRRRWAPPGLLTRALLLLLTHLWAFRPLLCPRRSVDGGVVPARPIRPSLSISRRSPSQSCRSSKRPRPPNEPQRAHQQPHRAGPNPSAHRGRPCLRMIIPDG